MHARRPTLVVGLLLIASLGSEGRADAQRTVADVTQACVDAHVSAQRLRRDRHLREARDALIACSRDTCPRVLVEECGPWLRDVDQAIPAVVIEAHAPDGSDASRVHVFVDGVSFADRLDGRAIEIDPGEHVFRYELAGSPPASETIVIREGEKSRRLSVHFAAPIARSPEIPAPLRPVPAAAYGLGALGVVGLAAFATFGAIGVAKKSDLEAENCKPNCTDVTPARRAFLAGDISLAVGVAALAGAAALYLTRPSVKPRASAHLHLGAVPALRPMLTVGGDF